MLETITTLVSLTKAAIGTAKGAVDLGNSIKEVVDKPDVDTTALRQTVSQLLDELIRLQAQQLTMQSAVGQLSEEQRRIERFERNADRYMLKRTEQGSLVRELKASHADGDPIHCVCAECYEKQVISFLQPVAHNTFECARCKSRVFMPDGNDIGIRVARSPLSTRWDIHDPYGDE
ncbi:hypothetical protein vBPeaSP1_046 [Pelagibaca phage vB_PeaS-P1]|nr:hypothetical protein vBPeaSP1_046 [Pelagibaca phage vB_PeaS-P1]